MEDDIRRTPRPWSVYNALGGELDIRGPVTFPNEIGPLIAHVNCMLPSPAMEGCRGQYRANAALLAAAPDLLFVLKQVLEFWLEGDIHARPASNLVVERLFDEVGQAISQAEKVHE